VAGEGQLAARREDAQSGPMTVAFGWEHEHRFRKVELRGDGLHAPGVEPLRIEHDGERVAGERLAREDVEREEAARHGKSSKGA
jgi:hypothetical protein